LRVGSRVYYPKSPIHLMRMQVVIDRDILGWADEHEGELLEKYRILAATSP